MSYKIVLSPEARRQLDDLYDYIADAASPSQAFRFVNEIIDYIEGLRNFPNRGARRDDILPSLRIIGFRRRVTIAFVVEPENVLILGVFYGGQDFEGILRDE